MFGWLRQRRRQALMQSSITDQERRDAQRGLWQFSTLACGQQDWLLRWSRVFVQEKYWEGCKGLTVTSPMKHYVALQAGYMVQAYPDWYFDRTPSIVIHPEPYVAQRAASGVGDLVVRGDYERSGETSYRSSVVLNWEDIQLAAIGPNEGHSLVVHEFAHQLDFINGPLADGLPPLPPHIDPQHWGARMKGEFELARSMVEQGDWILLDDYGLTELSEFFAVGSEQFFQQPELLARHHPGVYDLMWSFYQPRA
jgi:hypothetical protein